MRPRANSQNLSLLVAVGAAFVIGMPISRVLESYRGVVLTMAAGRMYVASEERPPRWMEAITTHPGAIVEKERGKWNAAEVETKAHDFKLVQLFHRYENSYEALIVRIDPPLSPGMAATAVADTGSGKQVRVPLWGEGLNAAAPGRRLRKLPGSWDPILLDEQTPSTTTVAP